MGASPGRILIVRPSALGDVARTVPVLASLRRAYPAAAIDWLVNDAFADVISHHPDLSAVVPFPRKRLAGFGWSPVATRAGFRFFGDLKRRGYDAVYDLQGLWRSGFLTWVTRGGKRVGPADARELGWLGYNRRVRIDPSIVHTVDRMLAVLEGDGIAPLRRMRLTPPPTAGDWAARFCSENELERGRYAVIAPTAAWESKRWPIERFADLISSLPSLGFSSCVVVGSAAESSQTNPLTSAPAASALRRIDATGRTTIGQLMALIETSGLVVANDSGALHLAVGLGVRCVGLYGPTDPDRVGPYRYGVGVVVAGCTTGVNYRSVDPRASGIDAISVDDALEGVRRVLQSPPPGAGE